MTEYDRKYIEEALKEAEIGYHEDEVPIGAVVVYQDKIIGRGHNQTEKLKDPTAHAEMIAISAAANYLGNWRLEGATIYVTVEPCLMCTGAIILSRIKRVVYGVKDPKFGFLGSLYDMSQDKRLNHQVEVLYGVEENKAKALLQSFFSKKRD